MMPNGLSSEVVSARLILPNEKINIEEEAASMRDRSALSGMPNQQKRTVDSSLLM